jgi:hypothetical protein
MATYRLKSKLFFEFAGQDIKMEQVLDYSKKNNVSKADALKALKSNISKDLNAKDLARTARTEYVNNTFGKDLIGKQDPRARKLTLDHINTVGNEAGSKATATLLDKGTNKGFQKAIGKNKFNYAASKQYEKGVAQGLKSGFNNGAKSVGIMGGLKNTWASGMGGKAKIIAGTGALLGAGMLAGRAMSGGNNDQR